MRAVRRHDASGAPAGITPDEAHMLHKRQQWRGRVLVLTLDQVTAGGGLGSATPALLADLRRDAPRLLRTEMVIPELEACRHAANHFLDQVIVYIRGERERRHREANLPGPPLESLSAEELAGRVSDALDRSGPALGVFVRDLLRLEEFDLEVHRQRRRLQFLLGCDRSLREIASSNAVVIEAGPEALERIATQFFAVCGRVRDELPELLVGGEAFPRLAAELAAARRQLAELVTSVLDPAAALEAPVASVEGRLEPLVGALHAHGEALGQLARGPLAGRWEAGLPDLDLRQRGLAAAARQVMGKGEELVASRPVELVERIGEERHADLAPSAARAAADLGRLLEEIATLDAAVDPLASEWRAGGIADEVAAARPVVRRVLAEAVQPARVALEELRERNLRALKEGICHAMGVLRTTFLQPRFAHIAANDPRSTHTAQYFYLKEFAEEAERSRQLLDLVQSLWRFVEGLQLTRLEGLRFTPANLDRIARRVLVERRAVPSGAGWRELAVFLGAVKDHLVPRLQAICTLPGIRFDDRNQLGSYAETLARSCSELLAQRETSWRLMQEISDLSIADGVPADTHQRYREVVLTVTCGEMAARLGALSDALRELLLYLGAMIGGIRMRTSLAFVRELAGGDESGTAWPAPTPRRGRRLA